MSFSTGFPPNNQMGSCISSQSRAEKQSLGRKGRSADPSRKAVMDRYPVSTKSRLAFTGVIPTDGSTAVIPNDGDITQLRSKLRPPSVSIPRPHSIHVTKIIDSNGNIPGRPSSLPRLRNDSNFPSKLDASTLIKAHYGQPRNAARTLSFDSKPTVFNAHHSVPHHGSPSPSLSTLSASSVGSNQSHSMTDSGIASSTRSPTISEKKSALSLKFGFYNRTAAAATKIADKKSTVDRLNSFNTSTPTKDAAQQTGSKLIHSSSPGGVKEAPTKSFPLARDRPSTLIRIPNPSIPPFSRIQQPTQPIKASCKSIMAPNPVKASTQQQLNAIKSRAALVLNRAPEYKSITMRPRLSVEAIVASLEKEIREQLGPDLPPLPPVKSEEKSPVKQPAPSIVAVERFGIEPIEAEVAYVESSPVDEFIDNIEPLVTPSSICTTLNSQLSPGNDDCPSRDDGHHGDEEDSAATSISDAMIDDEIADQPGLVMLGQSASVPASPMHSWRSDLFEYAAPTMALISYPPSEEDRSDSSYHGFLRRRVASVNDINGGLKESTAEATMRGELYSNWQDSIVIDLDEYTSMANELADIKAQLVALQNLLVEAADSNEGSSPLWDLKRDLVLLREELQEKNVTIKSLKNELRASGRPKNLVQSKATSCCNVATQTDRPRGSPLGNGLTPSPDEVQLVSFRISQY